MQKRDDSESDTPTGLTSVPWLVVDVRARPGYRLHVRFIDGTEGEVDLSVLLLAPTAGVFIPLRDPALFEQATVVDGAVTWPGDLDLAPDAMHEELKRNGIWIVEPFSAPR